MDDLVRLIREERIEQVFVAMPASADGLLVDVLERLSMLPVHVRLLPAVASMEFPNRPISTIAGMPVIHVSDKPISGRSEERRVGKACVSTCRSRWSPFH